MGDGPATSCFIPAPSAPSTIAMFEALRAPELFQTFVESVESGAPVEAPSPPGSHLIAGGIVLFLGCCTLIGTLVFACGQFRAVRRCLAKCCCKLCCVDRSHRPQFSELRRWKLWFFLVVLGLLGGLMYCVAVAISFVSCAEAVTGARTTGCTLEESLQTLVAGYSTTNVMSSRRKAHHRWDGLRNLRIRQTKSPPAGEFPGRFEKIQEGISRLWRIPRLKDQGLVAVFPNWKKGVALRQLVKDALEEADGARWAERNNHVYALKSEALETALDEEVGLMLEKLLASISGSIHPVDISRNLGPLEVAADSVIYSLSNSIEFAETAGPIVHETTERTANTVNAVGIAISSIALLVMLIGWSSLGMWCYYIFSQRRPNRLLSNLTSGAIILHGLFAFVACLAALALFLGLVIPASSCTRSARAGMLTAMSSLLPGGRRSAIFAECIAPTGSGNLFNSDKIKAPMTQAKEYLWPLHEQLMKSVYEELKMRNLNLTRIAEESSQLLATVQAIQWIVLPDPSLYTGGDAGLRETISHYGVQQDDKRVLCSVLPASERPRFPECLKNTGGEEVMILGLSSLETEINQHLATNETLMMMLYQTSRICITTPCDESSGGGGGHYIKLQANSDLSEAHIKEIITRSKDPIKLDVLLGLATNKLALLAEPAFKCLSPPTPCAFSSFALDTPGNTSWLSSALSESLQFPLRIASLPDRMVQSMFGGTLKSNMLHQLSMEGGDCAVVKDQLSDTVSVACDSTFPPFTKYAVCMFVCWLIGSIVLVVGYSPWHYAIDCVREDQEAPSAPLDEEQVGSDEERVETEEEEEGPPIASDRTATELGPFLET